MAKKQPPVLHVVFDTSIVFTSVASDLVKPEVRRIIQNNSNHSDLRIEWYLPEVVIGEREYQMLSKGKDLLPNLHKMEKLLGHSFGIGEDTLELHVKEAISKSLNSLKLKPLRCDTDKVDWPGLITRSVKRKPPFEANEKEKGFRDSVIAHSFIQLLRLSPSTPSICRLAFVSSDQALLNYVKELSQDAKNIRIFSNLDDLESHLNTLVSTVSEELVSTLTEKAEKLFFEKENEKSFYYKEKIGEKIKEQYANVLTDTKFPGALRKNGTWWIFKPIFEKKVKQCIYWMTSVEPEFEIYHYEQKDLSTLSNVGITGLLENGAESEKPFVSNLGLMGLALNGEKIVDLKGREKFEVHWRANLSQAHNLTTPKIDDIFYVSDDMSESGS